jgi:hypothetical protein
LSLDDSVEAPISSIQSQRLPTNGKEKDTLKDNSHNGFKSSRSLKTIHRDNTSNLFQETAYLIKKKYGLNIKEKIIDMNDIHRSFKQKSQKIIRLVKENAQQRVSTQELKIPAIEKIDYSSQRRQIRLTFDSH